MHIEKYSIQDVMRFAPGKMVGAMFLVDNTVLMVGRVSADPVVLETPDLGDDDSTDLLSSAPEATEVTNVCASVCRYDPVSRTFGPSARLSEGATRVMTSAHIPPHLTKPRQFSGVGYGMVRRRPGYNSFVTVDTMAFYAPRFNLDSGTFEWVVRECDTVTLAQALLPPENCSATGGTLVTHLRNSRTAMPPASLYEGLLALPVVRDYAASRYVAVCDPAVPEDVAIMYMQGGVPTASKKGSRPSEALLERIKKLLDYSALTG